MASENGAETSVLTEVTEGSLDPVHRLFKWTKWSPLGWLRMLAEKTDWSFVFAVVVAYGLSQGLGGSIWRVASDYYWKDVQRVQPASAQIYQGITSIPWIIKPIWGLATDVVSMAGYRRRPYFILAGLIGLISMLTLSLHSKLPILFALLAMLGGSAGTAISDVTVDACVAENSIAHPLLVSDFQSLCMLSLSIGRLIGYSISGLLVHAIGSQGALGILSIPSVIVFSIGLMLKESPSASYNLNQVYQKFLDANRTMWRTIKYPEIWRPSSYVYLSLALSVNIQEGMFYWYTDSIKGLSFSEGSIGTMFAIGSVGSLLGVILYQTSLKDYSFRDLLLWTQLLISLSGLLDLVLVLRLNLNLAVPDYVLAVFDEVVYQMVNRLKMMALLVLCTKLCPLGIEGTFFALLMSIENIGMLTSSWMGGLLLHVLRVTRTEFGNLWVAVLVRSLIRLLPLVFLHLVPRTGSDYGLTGHPVEMVDKNCNSQVCNKDPISVEMAFPADGFGSNTSNLDLILENQGFEGEMEVEDSETVSLIHNG
ncbi:hypothetical protein LUZ61_002757 [Rhynchospora tenuis]|uniref:Uncharacterized protein n=1 Tax=Rhynchospora tenuis TaxID=198213 RepID=A0AAD5ZJH5_9POAL|nr:hypothetical protein LUZ61_002757 [Rhynchospora tenuis]